LVHRDNRVGGVPGGMARDPRDGFACLSATQPIRITVINEPRMNELKPTMAKQLADSAMAFQQQRTGHAPHGVTVVLSDDTLMIKMDGALSPVEKALAKSPAGAAQVQEFHRVLFTTAAGSMRREIKR